MQSNKNLPPIKNQRCFPPACAEPFGLQSLLQFDLLSHGKQIVRSKPSGTQSLPNTPTHPSSPLASAKSNLPTARPIHPRTSKLLPPSKASRKKVTKLSPKKPTSTPAKSSNSSKNRLRNVSLTPCYGLTDLDPFSPFSMLILLKSTF